MIYQIIWTHADDSVASSWSSSYYGVPPGTKVEPRKALAEFIKTSEDDTFIFILVKNQGQYEQWKNWLQKYGLEKLVRVETSSGITNPIHKDYPDNLVLAVIQSEKHFQREEETAK